MCALSILGFIFILGIKRGIFQKKTFFTHTYVGVPYPELLLNYPLDRYEI